VVDCIRESGETAMCVQGDVSALPETERMIAAVRAELGPVDVLVNNAGITIDRTFENMSQEDWQRVIDVNLGGTFNCTKACYADLKAAEHGRLINISSVVG
jgi:3-oxoacyl-[acyl-carrier protein] reductase